MKKYVSDEDISFVVQGPIVDCVRKKRGCTKRLLKSIRKYFPMSQIVLSTWDDELTDGLDYDILVRSKQPRGIQIYYSGGLHLFTVNHQIVSTYNGLKKADREYVIKVRSDLLFLNNRILLALGKYLERDAQYRDWKIFSERIITLPTYNYRRGMSYPFNVADWIYAGQREDVMDLFDIPLLDTQSLKMRKGALYPYLKDNIGAEQYNCVRCIEKHKKKFDFWGWESFEKKYQVQSEIFLGQNFVLLSGKRIGITSQKIGAAGYCAEPVFSAGLYTFSEWKRLYNKYGGGNMVFPYNPFEDVTYGIILFLRRYMSKKHKLLYRFVVERIRQIKS